MDSKEIVKQALEFVTGRIFTEEELGSEQTLEGLDVDSLELLELDLIIEEQSGVRLPDDSIKTVKSVGQLIELVEANRT